MGAEASQAFLLSLREKWAPMGPPPAAVARAAAVGATER